MLTCIDSFDVEILDFERIFHEGDRVFRVLKGYVDWGGGAWLLLPMRGRPRGLQRAGWWVGPYVSVLSVALSVVIGFCVCLFVWAALVMLLFSSVRRGR